MKELIVSPKALEKLSDREVCREYLKTLNPCEGKSYLEILVGGLPKDEQRVVRLMFWYGMDTDEISSWTSMSRRKIEALLQRGLGNIREQLVGVTLLEGAA